MIKDDRFMPRGQTACRTLAAGEEQFDLRILRQRPSDAPAEVPMAAKQ
jgi:hypothetical protein